MSHVDKGALHAYLDGALDEYPAAEARHVREHLETCAECAGRLEEEREIRADATAMLGLAAPEVEVPTFEELRAYVRASRPQRTPRLLRLYRLGWAASVFLALGTGWMLRGGQVVPTAPFEVRAPAASAEADQATVTVAGLADALTEPQSVNRRVEEGVAVPANAVEALPSATVAAAAASSTVLRQNTRFADVADRDEVVVVADEFRADVETVAPGIPVSDDLVAAGISDLAALSLPPQQRDSTSEQEIVRIEEVAAFEDSRLSASVAEQRARDEQAAATPDNAASPPPAQARRAVEVERRSVANSTSLITALDAVASRGSLLGRGSAAGDAPRDEESERSLLVPGLGFVDLSWCREGTTPTGVCVLQRLESGDTLELIHPPEGLDLSSVPPAGEITFRENPRGDGKNELSVPRNGGRLIMRAALPEDSLRALLQRLDSGR